MQLVSEEGFKKRVPSQYFQGMKKIKIQSCGLGFPVSVVKATQFLQMQWLLKSGYIHYTHNFQDIQA